MTPAGVWTRAQDAVLSRTPRERWMLGVMAAALIAFFGWFLVLTPLQRLAEDRAEAAEAARVRLAEAERLTRPGAATARGAVDLVAEAEAAVGRDGLGAVRSQATATGVTVWMEGASAPAALGWVAEVQARGAGVGGFSAIKRAEGGLDVQVDLVRP